MKTLKEIVSVSIDEFEKYYASDEQNIKISEQIKTDLLKITDECIVFLKEKNYDPMVAGIFSYSAIAPKGKMVIETNDNYDFIGRMMLSISIFLREGS